MIGGPPPSRGRAVATPRLASNAEKRGGGPGLRMAMLVGGSVQLGGAVAAWLMVR